MSDHHHLAGDAIHVGSHTADGNQIAVSIHLPSSDGTREVGWVFILGNTTPRLMAALNELDAAILDAFLLDALTISEAMGGTPGQAPPPDNLYECREVGCEAVTPSHGIGWYLRPVPGTDPVEYVYRCPNHPPTSATAPGWSYVEPF